MAAYTEQDIVNAVRAVMAADAQYTDEINKARSRGLAGRLMALVKQAAAKIYNTFVDTALADIIQRVVNRLLGG